MTIHRKLIRPKIKEVQETQTTATVEIPSMIPISQPGGGGALAAREASGARRKQVPAEQTNAESFYYLKQMQTKTPMVFILQDGEQLRGYIEWYDRHCLKVNRHKEPNLMIMKQCVKYMYKQEDEVKTHRRRKRPDDLVSAPEESRPAAAEPEVSASEPEVSSSEE